ncbi:tRNA (adenine-N(1)-)-methyltransferase non-catalytic subunit [Blastomyces dermatitidis ATCC 18188]|uniref:tRNA (adenine(58)-N(1))-methyltransferase non-catalytic subunit TRM6 n=2 Tax=Ajellomyces dermatitidis (strain ATCC 18188 / CBS 674.68) TaxID=653446 RepID=F2TTM9_AJEDA|nr:tRNA (adenine-N(1)-)-methyltransferase non-catalytic subunit [Blastomyces dermatitidis ATCC 18188]
MHSRILPHAYIALRLPSDTVKVQQIVPNMIISLGKYGSFQANQIIGRPYHLTFEILDQPNAEDNHALRIVSAAELHAESLIADGSIHGEVEDGECYRDLDNMDESPMRTNRDTVDDSSSQLMTMDEIEVLKKGTTSAGRDIINKLLESHSGLDKKTEFSLAKYTLRKQKKYLKRFSVLPLDVPLLTQWMLEQKDATKILELRDEIVGLIGCWANVHNGGDAFTILGPPEMHPASRWLIVDDTGGLVVAAMAERMGILYPHETGIGDVQGQAASQPQPERGDEYQSNNSEPSSQFGSAQAAHGISGQADSASSSARSRRPSPGMTSNNTTLTMIHPNAQPNLSLLKYFSFDVSDPSPSHPLFTNLKTLSWLQLLDPSSDPVYSKEPTVASDEALASWKPSKRGMYYRKRRRWNRVRSVVDETRAGGFDGLIVASLMDPTSILKHTIPLLSGSAPVVVYAAHIEPLVRLADFYSTARRTAYINFMRAARQQEQTATTGTSSNGTCNHTELEQDAGNAKSPSAAVNESDFPVDPTLLLAPTIQTSRVRPWQVLPGRTHPLMIGRGGAEGYVFHALRALPALGKVEARGNQARKKRKTSTRDVTPAATIISGSQAGN